MIRRLAHNNKEVLSVIILVILGTLLRVYALDKYPPGLHGDEGWSGIEARRILTEGSIGVWSPAAFGQTAFPFYWVAFWFKLLGESVFSLRLAFALFSVLTIPFYYLFTREVFNKKVALAATFLFITGSIPLALARRADYVAASFGLFPALYFLVRGYRTHKWLHFLLAGLFTGIASHMYFTYWLTPPLIFLLMGMYFVIYFKKPPLPTRTQELLANSGIFLVGLLLVSLPLLNFFLHHPDKVTSRIQQVSAAETKTTLLQNVKSTVLMFNLKGDADIWSVFSHKPVFATLPGLFFITGFALMLLRLSKEKLLFFLFPFLFFILPTILSTDAPNFRRGQVSIFLAYILVAIGVVGVLTFFVQQKGTTIKRKFGTVLLTVITIGMGFYSTYQYFVVRTQSPETKYIMAHRLTEVAKFVKNIDPDYVYFYSDRWSYHYETLQFLLYSTPGEDRSTKFGDFSLERRHQLPVVYILLPPYMDIEDKLIREEPGGILERHYGEDGSIVFVSYYLAGSMLE